MKIFVSIPQNEEMSTFLTDRALANLEKLGEVIRNPYKRNLKIDELVEMAREANVIVTGWGTPFISVEALDKMPDLKVVAHTGGTVATLVPPEISDRGVHVLSGNNVFAKSVAEGCLAYTLASLRELEKYSTIVREGGWRETVFKNKGLIGKKVGLVGFGTIAKFYTELLHWFDCEILVYSNYLTDEETEKYGVKEATIEEIFSTCDIVSLHSSLTPQTKGMITRELLMMLRADTLFVNTARGALVDENALFELIEEGRFKAALDVFVDEPFAADRPVRKSKNALLIPHMGGPTIDMREVVMLELCKDIERMNNNLPLKNEISSEQIKRMSR